MTEKAVPQRLWDRGLVYEAQLLSLMSRGPGKRTGHEQVTGQTPDISEYLDFEFCDLVWCHTGGGVKLDTVDDPRRLGRWLGVSHRVGSDMCYWILTAGGKIIANATVQHVIRTDYQDPATKARIDEFNSKVNDRLAVNNFELPQVPGTMYLEDEPEDPPEWRIGLAPDDAEYGDMFGKPVEDVDQMGDTDTAVDQYLGAQLLLDYDGDPLYGEVVERAKDPSGNKIGRSHRNPLMDTREYLVKFKDESVRGYTANQIAQSIYSQVDSEGRSHALIEEIIGHKKDGTAVPKG